MAFNTLVDCKCSLWIGLPGKGATLPPQNCVIANNLVFSEQGPLVRIETEPAGFKWQGNLFYGAELGLPDVNSVKQLDPQLTKSSEGLYRPAGRSPAVGAATGSFAEIKDDIDGQPRGVKKDVGCDQASTTPVMRRPLTPADVGPQWLRASK